MTGFVPFLLASGSVLVIQLSATAPLEWRTILAPGLSAVLATVAASQLPRTGSAALAADVDRKRREGTSRQDMVVATTDEIVDLAGPSETATASMTRGIDDLIQTAQHLKESGVPVEEMVIQPRRGWKPRTRDSLGSRPTP